MSVHPKVEPLMTLRSHVHYDLEFRAHHPTELASVAIELIRPEMLTKHQLAALYTLQTALGKWSSDCSTTGQALPSINFMNTLFKPISDLFFLGSLNNISFRWEAGEGLATTIDGRQFTIVGYARTDDQNRSHIRVYGKYFSERFTDPAARQIAILGTLIHECVHAFLTTYSCSSSKRRCQETKCKADFVQHTGYTGHGDSFVDLARSVQEVAKELLKLEIDIGLAWAIGYEEQEIRRRSEEALILTGRE